MRVILDTNVFISGVFFSGPPYQILDAWRKDKIKLVISPEIFEEYRRVGEELTKDYPGVSLGPFLSLAVLESEIVLAPKLNEQICADPDDDKFISCAIVSGCRCIVTGDKQLKKLSGHRDLEILTPRQFVDKYL